jgi:hypothetical protein
LYWACNLTPFANMASFIFIVAFNNKYQFRRYVSGNVYFGCPYIGETDPCSSLLKLVAIPFLAWYWWIPFYKHFVVFFSFVYFFALIAKSLT